MKLLETPSLPSVPESNYDRGLQQALMPLLRNAAIKVNQIGDGRIAGFDEVRVAAPTSGAWQQGDQVKNVAPAELGSPGSRYVLLGWVCVVSGTPGTWQQMRVLTGN